MFEFTTLDTIVVVIYFLIMVGIIYFSSRSVKSSDDFLIGGKRFGSFATMATQGASMKGSASLVGYAGGAWTNGIGVLFASQCYNMGGWLAVMIGLARRLKKCGDALDIKSVGDVFKYRYNDNKVARICGGIASTWLALATMASQLVAISLLLYMAAGHYGLTYNQCLVISGVIAVGCTIFGGLVSVIYTDVFQWCVMTPTIFVIIPLFCIMHGATPSNIHATLAAEQFFDLRPNPTWIALLMSGLLTSVADIVYLTRFISAKDERSAVRGSTFGFLYTTLWAGIVLFFGLAAAILIKPDMVTGTDQVLYKLMGMVLPSGLLGLFGAALFATTISTIDSYLHIAVVAVTVDIRDVVSSKKLTDRQELIFARVLTVVLTALCVIFVVSMKGIIAIFNLGWGVYASAVFMPLMATFFWRKATAESTLAGIATGVAAYLFTYYSGWKLPIMWGVGLSLAAVVIVALIQNKDTDLLPGFGDRGKVVKGYPQDVWIFGGALVGCIGTLAISIGVGMWVNWIHIVVGLVVMSIGMKLLTTGTPKGELDPAAAVK
ncbi:sodium:solute symporter family protein [Synergistaceae bacterium OttesenSCG-928-I11]|nr:sodium:solute symporter family protein [Synergistaceae bacterium OttesenSCG-928-I11]